MTRDDKLALLQFVAALLLWLFCLVTPWLVLVRLGPLWGLLCTVAAFLLYAWQGPRPFPGFLPGIMSVWILFGSFGCVVFSIAVLVKHFIRHGA